MAPRTVHWLTLILVLVSATAALLLAGSLIEMAGVPSPFALALALALIGIAAIASWLIQDFAWLRPLEQLEREVRLQLYANPTREPVVPARHGLGTFPDCLETLSRRLSEERACHERAAAADTALSDQQRARLEAVLQGLADGVVGCSADRRILLFNEAARRMLGSSADLGLDRPLDRLLAPGPVRQVFGVLRRKAEAGLVAAASAPFACAGADGARVFRCRMVPFGTPPELGFVLTFAEVWPRHPEGTGPRELMRRIRAVRGPAGSVLAAAELLAASDLERSDRARFGGIVERDGEVLRERLGRLEAAIGELADATWPEADFLSSDLALHVGHLLGGHPGSPTLVPVGPAVWMRGDVVHLAAVIEHLLHEVGALQGDGTFDFEALAERRRVQLDLSYDGAPVPPGTLERWLAGSAREGGGPERPGEVLERHGAEIWSGPVRPGRARVRLLLPAAEREEPPPPVDLEPRPEFYDFDLLNRFDPATDLFDRPLGALTFVVFDTETTGLDPDRDRIVQLAAVRLVNGRLLTGETFDRLVDPGRPIPKSSIRFHGITDEMVRGRPPIEVVLPQFLAFAEGAVLVAHNAAFDLAFLRPAAEAAGGVLDQPVLDTLLLSVALHGHLDQHGLDAILARFGVTLNDRHQALGDALGTAQVFLKMIDLLAGQGVRTLGEALALERRAAEVRRRQIATFETPGGARTVRVSGD